MLRHLIWVYTVCSGLSVPILKVNTVIQINFYMYLPFKTDDYLIQVIAGLGGLDARPTGDQEVGGSTPPGWQHSFVEI